MKIALIWPNGFDASYVMPLALGYLKSNLDSKKHDVKLLDCAFKNITASSNEFTEFLEKFKPEVIGTSCWSPTYEETLQILKIAKSIDPNITTVLGGAHASSYPDSAINHNFVDFLFRGEAELSFPIFLEELEKDNPNWSKVKGLVYKLNDGSLMKNEMERERNVDVIKIPDYEWMELDRYIKGGYRFNTTHKYNAPVWVTRGCPYRCGFCSAPLQNGKIIRMHSVEYMVKWVKYLYSEKGIRQINIIDDNFTFHKEYAKEFCRAMIKLNLKGLTFGTPNAIRAQRTDLELIQLMKDAGWEHLLVAPESGSRRVLDLMHKDLDPQAILEKVKIIQQVGLKIHGAFIIGYPGETIEDIKETVKLIRECKFNFFFLNNFQPLPGTPIYDELVAKGEIADGLLPKNYSNGERAYTPKELKNFNFSKFVLKEYFMLALREPLNIPYMLTLIGPGMVVKKLFHNLKNIVKPNSRKESIIPKVMISTK
ncbi:B12-binding domain-containing radical SAM protein [Candidatus Woesearchaeota archaeon]|nr:B12-binding domain-containing radical SAM protein [Candidatus Woesearchaeota archaeon]